MHKNDLKQNSFSNVVNLESHYTDFWAKRLGVHFYPPEFLVRTFLSNNCPKLIIEHDYENKNVLDLGTEITREICEAVTLRMAKFGIKADIRVGRNNSLPFEDHSFDYVVASASVYYVDAGTTFEDNMLEIQRVLKPGGHIVFSLVHPDSYILNGANELLDSHFRINNDPLGLRNGYFFKVFKNHEHITEYFSKNFIDISIGHTSDDYYGLKQDLWLLVAKK